MRGPATLKVDLGEKTLSLDIFGVAFGNLAGAGHCPVHQPKGKQSPRFGKTGPSGWISTNHPGLHNTYNVAMITARRELQHQLIQAAISGREQGGGSDWGQGQKIPRNEKARRYKATRKPR